MRLATGGYGPPGNGKSSIAEAIGASFEGIVYIPYAVEVDGQIIKVFDPTVHDIAGEEGEPKDKAGAIIDQGEMFEVTRDAIAAMTEAAAPGRPLGEIDDAHRRVFDDAGYGDARMAACGYSIGATFRPSWMDVPPMLYSGNPMEARPGMVLFLHAILADAERNLAMSLGHTVIVGRAGAEVLTRLDHEYTVCA